ncbi:hypothetical protein RchiOBHm_Chr2g0112911 [Rosa chinensis]|uniref:Uncharacterized protein n=1 Tax=Rosa chinensis TaxID=74649 RepID=A0A2P6RQB2_ROSCH|nr:hypothetical protein RchiOBHm_Chr2g0112911 [Rosa chinensis]
MLMLLKLLFCQYIIFWEVEVYVKTQSVQIYFVKIEQLLGVKILSCLCS